MWQVKTFEKYLLLIVLLLIPSQLSYHFWPNWAYVYGLKVDFLSPTIYLTDIFIIILFFLNLKLFGLYKKQAFLLSLFALINILFSVSPAVSLSKWLKIFELLMFAVYISKQNIVKSGLIIKSLFYSSVFYSLIGIAQFFTGSTLGGILYWLGERSFSLMTPGIALVNLNGIEYLRAYSTFSHPNSLAGYLSVVIILSIGIFRTNKQLINVGCYISILLAIVLTFSLSSYVGFVLIGLLHSFKMMKKISRMKFIVFTLILISLMFPIFAKNLSTTNYIYSQSVSDRLELGLIAGTVISRNFLFGTGLGAFLINTTNTIKTYSHIWLLQPVHNIFLLILSELGILGFIGFCILLIKYCSDTIQLKVMYRLTFVFIMVTGMFDHYWLTLQQNQLLLAVVLGLSYLSFKPSTTKLK